MSKIVASLVIGEYILGFVNEAIFTPLVTNCTTFLLLEWPLSKGVEIPQSEACLPSFPSSLSCVLSYPDFYSSSVSCPSFAYASCDLIRPTRSLKLTQTSSEIVVYDDPDFYLCVCPFYPQTLNVSGDERDSVIGSGGGHRVCLVSDCLHHGLCPSCLLNESDGGRGHVCVSVHDLHCGFCAYA